ncbi:hypothetical protein [Actinoplanes utahensis]|uniref:hypothetical protein n=1 Tax=Actinoplanes utahensis TaxID=1869 RepID=UPI000AA68ECB|nr:hypothetical protein [Actinoplanes utahensis]
MAEILHDDGAMPAAQVQQLQVIYQSAQELQRLLDHAASPLQRPPRRPAREI